MPSVVNINPEILSGTPVFMGTRVPIEAFFEFIEHGRTIDYFLESFPSVKREQTVQLLEEVKAFAMRQPVPA